MSVLNVGTTVRATFNGTDIPGYLFGMIVPAHGTVAGYIENSLRGSGYFSGAVAEVTSGSVGVTATTSRQMDSNEVLNAIRFALMNSYVDLSSAQASFNVLGVGVGLPAPTNYGGFISELATQVGSNTGALASTGASAAWQGINAAFQGNGLIVIGGLALVLVLLMKRD
jgi:hypothetical protein